MSIAFERDDVRRRIVLTTTGVVTGRDLRAAIDRQVAEGLWRYGALYDTTGVTVDPSAQELRQLTQHVRVLMDANGQRGPVAMVAPTDAVFGMGRMYEALADPRVHFKVFRTRPEAERWLDETIG